MFCIKCGKEIDDGRTSCNFCGEIFDWVKKEDKPQELQSDFVDAGVNSTNKAEKIICNKCQKELPIGSVICNYCGEPVAVKSSTILCKKCHAELPSESIICNFCGEPVEKAPVIITCDNCHKELPAGSIVCNYCGKPLVKEPSTVQCSRCHKELPIDSVKCNYCGEPVIKEPKTILCSKCRSEIPAESIRCYHCGAKVGSNNFFSDIVKAAKKTVPVDNSQRGNIINNPQGLASNTDAGNNSSGNQPVIVQVNQEVNTVRDYIYKSRTTAFFLCLFLGFLGGHRFYVGKIGTGLLWLVTLGFFGVGAILDLIFIVTGSFRDKAGYPLR